jgi:DNA primase
VAFPAEFLGELRSRLSLSSIVGRRVRLTKAGREYKACCPFHNEKTPSFYVNDDKEFFHCFGCGAHGDVIGFTMRADHLSFPEAVEKLAGEAGIDVPKLSPTERREAERAKTLTDVVEAACVWFEQKLRAPEGRAALGYLYRRGLHDDVIERFRLGYAPEGWRNLIVALKAKGYSDELMLEAGLISKPEDRPEPYDFFRNRVMFPITDRRGRVIAFGGRVMDDSKPKYLNSRDTPIFHKRGNLYGLDKARVAVGAKKARVVVTEGYMDVIALHQVGFEGAVAPLGTALTEEQLEALWRVHSEPIVCLDGDAAGRAAAIKAADTALPLLEPDRTLRFATIPGKDDPDSLIQREGVEAMARVLKAAKGLADIVWEHELATRETDTPDRRASLEKALRDRVTRIVDRIVAKQYEQDWIWGKLRRLGRPALAYTRQSNAGWQKGARAEPQRRFDLKSNVEPEKLRYRTQEVILMCALNFPNVVTDDPERFAAIDFSAENLARLKGKIMDAVHELMAEGQPVSAEALKNRLAEWGFQGEIDEVVVPESFQYGPYWHGYFARPPAHPGIAEIGFRDLLNHYKNQHDLKAELDLAVERFAYHPEPSRASEEIDRIRAELQKLLEASTDEMADGIGEQVMAVAA